MLADAVHAENLIYRPVNPSFGGNPLNSNHLYQGAELTNEFEDVFDLFADERTAADDFLDSLQSSVIAGAASQITQAIFEDGAPPSGIFTLEQAVVSYETVGSNVIVRVNDGVSTRTLTIPKPPTS
jgi:curli production assembly/transport component CsgF